MLAFVGVAVMAGLLAVHAMSGFQNPVVLRDVVLSSGAMPYTQYVNFDKTLAGVLVLALGWFAPLRTVRDWSAMLRRAAPIVGATIAVVMAASLALGFVRFDPRWTPLFWVWAPINLLLTCVSEEALFRGFLQREIGVALDGRAVCGGHGGRGQRARVRPGPRRRRLALRAAGHARRHRLCPRLPADAGASKRRSSPTSR